MLTRIISALIALPALLYIVIKGGLLLKISVLVIAFLGLNEFYNAFGNANLKPSKAIGITSTLLIFLMTFNKTEPHYIMLWFFINMVLVLFSCLRKETDILSSILTVFGVFYIVFFMFHIVFIANLTNSYQFIWLIFISAWATDTFAYFTGYFFGNRKLCPDISPKKTVEGAIGGIIGSILLCSLFMYSLKPTFLFHGAIIGLLGSVIAQAGDLTASLFKRYVGIKDYGKIMPGHGGVLDRFDSILFTAPMVYYYIILVLNALEK